MFTYEQEADYTIILFSLFALLLITIILISAILYHNRRKKHLQETTLMQSKFDQALLQTQLEIQEQTLKTIAEEIHDNIGQVLSLAKLHLNTFTDSMDAVSQIKVADTKQLVSKAINDLRDLSRSMHGEKITEIGLQHAIENELQILQNTKQYQTHLLIMGTQYKLEPQKEIILFRIVQESLNNIVKHSKANSINVVFRYQPLLFIITIADNGIGFDTNNLSTADTGIGLKNMHNRAALIGGKFSIHSIAGNGTCITIELAQQL